MVYAVDKKKKIIPLNMEPNFKPDGWLKFYLSDTLRLDFSNDELFHGSVKKLLITLPG